jgi:hypothetical protein
MTRSPSNSKEAFLQHKPDLVEKHNARVWLVTRFVFGGLLTGILPIVDIRLLVLVIPICVLIFVSGRRVQQRKWTPIFITLLTVACAVAIVISILLNTALGKTREQQVVVIFVHTIWFFGTLFLSAIFLIIQREKRIG